MKRRAAIIPILLCVFSASCAKRATNPPDRNVIDAFGIVVKDTPLNLSGQTELKPQLSLDSHGQVNFQSRDWLDASRRMFETADVLSGTNFYDARLHLIKMAQEISGLYYSYNNAATPMTSSLTPPGNPYLEEAYYYVKDILDKQYKTTMTNSSSHVSLAAASIVVKTSPKIGEGLIDMDQVFEVITSILNDFVKNLKALDDDSTKEVTEQIASKIQTDYLNFLKTAQVQSAMTGPKETSLSYSNRIQALINLAPSDFLPPDIKGVATKALQEIIYFASQVDQCTTPQTTMQTFINLWTAKQNRAKYPKEVSSAVRAIFAPYNDTEIVAMLDDNKSALVDKDQWTKVASKKEDVIKAVNANSGIVDYVRGLIDLTTEPAPSQGDAIFAALVNDWYNMDFRSNLAEMKSLWKFSEDDLNKMYKVNSSLFWQGHVVLAVARAEILSLLGTFNTPFPNGAGFTPGIDWFKGYVNYKIIHAIQVEIATQILKVAPQIPDQIKVATLKTLADLKVASKQNVGDLFKSLATGYLDKWIFNGAKALPLLEKNQVNFSYSNMQLTPLQTPNETSAEILGIGFSNSVERLNSLDYANLKPDQPEVRAMAFQTLCKMATLSGYFGIDDAPVPSLLSSFSPKGKAPAFDIATYDPAKGVYAASDNIRIKDNYKPEVNNQRPPVASVHGQMEMLAGLTKMINYLKPWSPSTFDASLASLHIDEFPTETVFDKSSMFQQSLALAASIIKNVPQMVALITLDGKIYPMAQVKDLSSLELGGAVLTDFDQKGISHVIRTHDLALSVIAIGQFFDAMKDLSSSQDKTVRDAAAEIQAQRPLINQLFLGISMFGLSKLMAEDGGFMTSFNLDTQVASTEPRLLSDQLLMEEALLVIGDFLNRNFIRLRAIDNFFFLNSTMWNDQLGFYNGTDDKTKITLKLADVAEAVKDTVLLRPLLATLADANPALRPSLAQLDNLQKTWTAHYFNESIASVQTILKLGIFAPPLKATNAGAR